MNILQRHTAQYFGTMQHGIKRSGKVIYTARGAASSDLGLWGNGKQLPRHNYSRERKNSMPLIDRILYR